MYSGFDPIKPAKSVLPRGIVGSDYLTFNLLATNIEPSHDDALSGVNRYEDPSVETRTARMEAFQTVDGGKACLGIVKGEKFPVHGSPVARCGVFQC